MTLTGDPVDGTEGPQHTHCADGREAHVVSVQRVLHHAGGVGVLRKGRAQRPVSPITVTHRPTGAINMCTLPEALSGLRPEVGPRILKHTPP